MRRRPSLALVTALVSVLLVGASVSPVSAAATSFGAKLTTSSQPDGGNHKCDENSGVPTGSVCTWVATTAFENGSRFTAPKTGTIKRVKLITCPSGSFTVQVARKVGAERFKVIRSGPTISYKADPFVSDGDPDTFCGGDDGRYVIQSFPVSFSIAKGDYIAIKTKKTGALHCSGGGASVIAPALAPGRPATWTARRVATCWSASSTADLLHVLKIRARRPAGADPPAVLLYSHPDHRVGRRSWSMLRSAHA